MKMKMNTLKWQFASPEQYVYMPRQEKKQKGLIKHTQGTLGIEEVGPTGLSSMQMN